MLLWFDHKSKQLFGHGQKHVLPFISRQRYLADANYIHQTCIHTYITTHSFNYRTPFKHYRSDYN